MHKQKRFLWTALNLALLAGPLVACKDKEKGINVPPPPSGGGGGGESTQDSANSAGGGMGEHEPVVAGGPWMMDRAFKSGLGLMDAGEMRSLLSEDASGLQGSKDVFTLRPDDRTLIAVQNDLTQTRSRWAEFTLSAHDAPSNVQPYAVAAVKMNISGTNALVLTTKNSLLRVKFNGEIMETIASEIQLPLDAESEEKFFPLGGASIVENTVNHIQIFASTVRVPKGAATQIRKISYVIFEGALSERYGTNGVRIERDAETKRGEFAFGEMRAKTFVNDVTVTLTNGKETRLVLKSDNASYTRNPQDIKMAYDSERAVVAVSYEDQLKGGTFRDVKRGVAVMVLDSATANIVDNFDLPAQWHLGDVFLTEAREVMLLSLPEGDEKNPMKLTVKAAR